MGTVIAQTVYETLEPGTYRGKLAAAVVEDGEYGKQVAARFDLLDEGFEDQFRPGVGIGETEWRQAAVKVVGLDFGAAVQRQAVAGGV